jgi:putative ABC transport system permease protein
MIGVAPALGRLFGAAEEVPGADRVVLLANPLWRRRFGEDPGNVGRLILVDGEPTTVIGVLPADFKVYQADLDLWMPLPANEGMHERANHSVQVFGRLADGVTMAAAQLEMDAIAAALAPEHPDTNDGWGVRLVPLYPVREIRDLKPALLVLLGASAFVRLIACANVAKLLYARAFARQREIAVRAAIGASRSRLLRQMIAESLLLTSGGAAAGLLIARWAIPPFVAVLPHADTNQGVGQFGGPIGSLDLRMLAIALGCAAATGLLFGLAPALGVTLDADLHRLRAASRASAKRALIVGELALSVVLLVGAALLIESVWRLQQIDPGFRPDHLLTMQVSLPRGKYTSAGGIRAFYDRVLRAVDRLPGVARSAAVSYRPFLGMAMSARVRAEGQLRVPDDDNFAGYCVVTADYLHVLGQPVVRGRDIAESDDESAEPVAVINQTMAERLWPGEDPLGRRLRPDFAPTDVPWAVDAPARWLTVVGVAADIKEFRLDERPRPMLYVAHRQFPFAFMFLIVRTTVPPGQLAGSVEREIAAIDREQPVSNVRTMDDAIARAVPRFHAALLVVFAAVALLLSAVGVYGVMAYLVGQRTREIGVRMALGATSRQVVAGMMREVAAFGALGAAIGATAALLVTRVMRTLLFGVAPSAAAAYLMAAGVLFAVALVAGYVPARRATQIDPTSALRCE